MGATVTSIGLKGLEGYRVQVEVQAMDGMDCIVIVGLPDASVKESKERISAALVSMGYSLHEKKVVINLSPAEQKKNGPLFDLPMAIGMLMSMDELKVKISPDTAFIGALSLDGSIRPVEGMLPAVLAARKLGIKSIYIPYDEDLPPLSFPELDIIYVTHLHEVLQHLQGQPILPLFPKGSNQPAEEVHLSNMVDFQDIVGHKHAKFALEVAAAGEHHVLMAGPPGCGKSLLAESFPSILPPLTEEASLEMISLYQLSGETLMNTRIPPYRNPHHSASGVSIIGGGQNPKPGEVSLAHRGVLFLDEVAEFSKKTLDMLRQPLETGRVTISRARSTVTYPAQFILLAAMNPCPCGYLGSNTHYCTCTPNKIQSYQNKLSGPIRDRFDIFLSLRPVDLNQRNKRVQDSSDVVRKRVDEARKRQYERYNMEICNSRVPFEQLMKTSPLTIRQQNLINQVSAKGNYSNRTQVKIIRLARTISDLKAEEAISDESLWQAIYLNNKAFDKREKQIFVTI